MRTAALVTIIALVVINAAIALLMRVMPTRLSPSAVACAHTHSAELPTVAAGADHAHPRPCPDCALKHRVGACRTNLLQPDRNSSGIPKPLVTHLSGRTGAPLLQPGPVSLRVQAETNETVEFDPVNTQAAQPAPSVNPSKLPGGAGEFWKWITMLIIAGIIVIFFLVVFATADNPENRSRRK